MSKIREILDREAEIVYGVKVIRIDIGDGAGIGLVAPIDVQWAGRFEERPSQRQVVAAFNRIMREEYRYEIGDLWDQWKAAPKVEQRWARLVWLYPGASESDWRMEWEHVSDQEEYSFPVMVWSAW